MLVTLQFNSLKCNAIDELKLYLTQSAQFSERMVKNMLFSNQNISVSIKGDTFINPNGTQMLFKVRHGKIQRLDQCQLHGFNFNRFLFEYNGNIYTLGGYGFYTSNKILQKFNFESHEWDFISIKNIECLQEGLMGIMYKHKNQVICIKNVIPGNIIHPDKCVNKAYSIDLSKFAISEIHVDTHLLGSITFSPGAAVFQSTQYLLYCNQSNTLIIHKALNQFIVVPNNMYHLWAITKNKVQILGDVISLMNVSLTDSSKRTTIHLNNIWKDTFFQKKNIELPANEIDFNTILSIILIIIVVILLIGLGWFLFYIKNRQQLESKATHIINNDPQDLVLEKLKEYNYSKVTSDQLDEIFGISHMEINSRKTKRNRIIEKVNNQFPNAIERNRDQNDRRIIIYNIHLG